MHHVMSVLFAQVLPYVDPASLPAMSINAARARILTSTDYAILTGVALPMFAFASSVFRQHRRYRLTPLERQARRHCLDPLVWLNTQSGIYYFEGERWYKRTREGMMLPLLVAQKRGNRPARLARRPISAAT